MEQFCSVFIRCRGLRRDKKDSTRSEATKSRAKRGTSHRQSDAAESGNPKSKNHAAEAAIKIKAAQEAGKFIFQAGQDGFIVIL